MSTQIWRFEIPVDDEWHEYILGSDPLHIAVVRPDLVEFWTYSAPTWHDDAVSRRLRLFGTGQDLPDECRHLGTCVATVELPMSRLRVV